jgi:hypothetical protein
MSISREEYERSIEEVVGLDIETIRNTPLNKLQKLKKTWPSYVFQMYEEAEAAFESASDRK